MKLTIYGKFPNLNEIIKASKAHHMQYSNMKKQYTNIVQIHAKKQKLPKMNQVDITFIWFCENKRADPDNIAVAKKFILDGLVKSEVLKNDGWKEVHSLQDYFEIDKKNPRVEVIFEERKK